jgi:hypothetical protein
MALDLRPLTLGELLDRSFSIYRKHFWMFVGIMAVPSVLALALSVLSVLIIAMVPAPPVGSGGTLQQTPAAAMRTLVWISAVAIAIFVTVVVYFITYAVTLGATTVAVSQIYLDRPGTIRSAFLPLKGKVGRLSLLFLLVALRIVGVFILGTIVLGIVMGVLGAVTPIFAVLALFPGMMSLVALSIWLALRYSVAVPVAVLEDETATEAIGRSVRLTEGYRWRVFVLLLFTMVIAYAVLFVFQGPFLAMAMLAGPGTWTYVWSNLLSSVFGAIGSAVTSPLMVVAFAVLYYDLRVRKEGFDLDVMLAKLGPAGTHS